MDFALSINGLDADMTWEPAADISNNVWLSLMVPVGSFFARPSFGSKLHLLRREKSLPRVARLAEQYVLEALQWIMDLGRATSVTAAAELAPGRINLAVAVVQADGRELTYELFVEVI